MAKSTRLRDFLAEDFRGMVPVDQRHRLARIVAKLTVAPSMQAIVTLRLSQWAYRHRLKMLAFWLQGVNIRRTGADIHPAAEIGAGLKLPHTVGIVIGNHAQIGGWFTCYHGVTVGRSDASDRMPVLGDCVVAGAGAKLLGAIEVGPNAVIGANSVVTNDVAAGSTVVGSPARAVR
jgi:serine O-acetyltransferase